MGTERLVLGNEHLSLAWDQAAHKLEIVDPQTGQGVLDPDIDRRGLDQGLWQVDLDEGHALCPARARRLEVTLDGDTLTWRWSGFEINELVVTVNATLSSSGLTYWHLALEGVPEGWCPEAIRFPRWVGLARTGPQENLAVPGGLGRLIGEPREWLIRQSPAAHTAAAPTREDKPQESYAVASTARRRWAGVYPGGLSMQFMALYDPDERGLYLSTDDGAAHRKSMAWQVTEDGGQLDYELLNYPPLPLPGRRYELPYCAVLGTFQGDWLTAAEIYRPWALQQSWCVNSRFAHDRPTPWLRETGLWMWNRGVSAQVVSPAKVLQDYLDVPISILWHWWHGCAYDTGFPEYLPPRQDGTSFKAAVSELKERGIHPIVYINGRLWGTTTQSWETEKARTAAAEKPSGETYAEVYNKFTSLPCAPMCSSTDLWQAKLTSLLRETVCEYGLPGIYMDQVAIAPPMRCYNTAHGHALSGGNVWAGGYHRLMDRVRTEIADTPVATEGCCEVYMDAYDAFLTLDASVERYSATVARDPSWQPIPLYTSVYHGRALCFGSYNSLVNPPYDGLWPASSRPADTLQLVDRRYSAQFRLDIARQFVWGLEPMLANFMPQQLETRSEELAFLRRLVRLRAASLKYLRDGTFVRPPAVARMPESNIALRTRSIYTSYDRETSHTATVPAVLMSAWRAPDGSVALALVNVSDQNVDLELAPNWEAWELSGAESWWQLDEDGGRRRLASAQEQWSVAMAPQEALVVEWTGE